MRRRQDLIRDSRAVPVGHDRSAARSVLLMLSVAVLGAVVLTGCGGVKIAPKPQLPKALVNKTPAKVGLVVQEDQGKYEHSETRSGVPWTITLGEGHRQLAREVFSAAFTEAVEFSTVDAAKGAGGLQAIFEPRIEQYSFATARETGGDYVAVTIRYRIDLFTGSGEPVDSFSLTGYGNSLAGGMSSSDPLDVASRAAMRDAAAKFLTQFPQQAVAQQLSKGQSLVAESARPTAAMTAMQTIEAVPVRANRRVRPAIPTGLP
jgi:hypothetical protein